MALGVAAHSARDTWDWLIIALSLVGAATATVAFAAWALDRRRRPEAQIRWEIALDGNRHSFVEWGPEELHTLNGDAPLLVRVAMRNVGDALADSVLTNFIVPRSIKLTRPSAPSEEPIPSIDPISGDATDYHRARYFARDCDYVACDDWVMLDYALELDAAVEATQQLARLQFVISCPRFNAQGYRWLPSYLFNLSDHHVERAGAGAAWPPPQSRRTIRWVSALPHRRVRCGQGQRSDVRDIRLGSPPHPS
jgi:hypothetical protein